MFKKILLSSAVLGALVVAGSSVTDKVSADSTQNVNLKVKADTFVAVNDNATGDGWSKPYGDDGAQWVVSLNDLRGKYVHILSKSTSTTGGTNWIKVQSPSVNNGQAFYIDASQSNVKDIMFENTVYATYMVNQKDPNAFFLTQPWGTANAQILGTASDFKYVRTTNPVFVTDNGGTVWAKVKLNGKTGYINAKSLSAIQSGGNTSGTAYDRYGVILH